MASGNIVAEASAANVATAAHGLYILGLNPIMCLLVQALLAFVH
jgi:hypothetical protein